MKKHLILPVFAATLVLASCGSNKNADPADKTDTTATSVKADEAESTEFVSEAGRFSINFAEKPTEQTKDVPTEVGNIKMYMFLYEESVTKVYMVAYADYPSELVEKANDNHAFLEGAKGGVIEQFGATVSEEKFSKFQGYDALDFIAGSPQLNTSYKMVLAGNRFYQISILQDGQPIAPEDTDMFIGSFKIID